MAQNLQIVDDSNAVLSDLMRGIFRLEHLSYSQRNPEHRVARAPSKWGGSSAFIGLDQQSGSLGLIGEGLPANLIGHRHTLERAFDRNRLWHNDPIRSTSYWLAMQAEGESALKRSLLYDASLIDLADQELDPFLRDSKMRMTFQFTRHPLWENLTAETLTSSTDALGWSATFAPSANPGTAPGRIASLTVSRNAAGGGANRVWLGIRPTLYGSTGFTPIWEAEAGSNGTDTSDQADGTASGGTCVRCTFATVATEAERFIILGNQVYSSNYSSAYGRYLVLARVRTGASTVVNMRLAVGLSSVEIFRTEPVQFGADTNWRLVELGEVQIPPADLRSSGNASGVLANLEIRFRAERVSGASYLEIDSLVFIPADHFVFADGIFLDADNDVIVLTHPNDTTLAYRHVTGAGAGLATVGEATIRDFYYPIDGGLVVMAAENDSGHSHTGNLYTVSLSHVPRWLSYRS